MAVAGRAKADSPWVPLGPYGQNASIRSLIVDPSDPSILWAAIDDQTHGRGGVLKSSDGGQSWTRFNFADSPDVFAIAIDPTTPSTVFAGGQTLFRTQDGGASWTEISPALRFVASIAVDPQSSSVVYVVADGLVKKSTDGGTTWFDSSNGLPPYGFQIAIGALSSSTLYLAEDGPNGGIFKSTDAGASWALVNSLGAQVLFVSKSPFLGIFAGTAGGVLFSGDGGLSFEPAGLGLPGGVTSFAAGSSTLFAGTGSGVWKSTDGRNWTPLGPSTLSTPVWSVALGDASGATIYAGTDTTGVFRSLDGGADWAASNRGITGAIAEFIAVDPAAPSTLVAGLSPSDVLKSSDRGATWTEVNPEENPDTGVEEVSAIAFDPSTPGVFYVGRSRDGLFKTTDGGATWSHADSGLAVPPLFGSQYVTAVTVDPRTPGTLYAGLSTFAFGGFLDGYVFKSTDGGTTWAQLPVMQNGGWTFAIAIDRASGTIYVPGARSTDGGASWQSFEGPCNTSTFGTISVAANSNVYMACGTLYKSVDHAANWSPLDRAGTVIAAAVDPSHPFTVYAGGPNGVMRTLDAGSTFTLFADGLTDPSVVSLAVDSQNPSRVYAGSQTTGIFAKDFFGPAPSVCTPSATTLCLLGGRFQVNVSWSVPSDGRSGNGAALPLTDDTGSFWFFSAGNIELALKVLDGRALNGAFWVFYGALSNVQYTITVTDTETGAIRTYDNPAGTLSSRADTAAFPGAASQSAMDDRSAGELYGLYARRTRAAGRSKSADAESTPDCVSGGATLCLDARYMVSVDWKVPAQGMSGLGTAVSLTADTGYFWFFDATNIELMIKVLDGEAVNGHEWVFYGALSNVQYTITVKDTVTGAIKTYANASGQLASVADTEAF